MEEEKELSLGDSNEYSRLLEQVKDCEDDFNGAKRELERAEEVMESAEEQLLKAENELTEWKLNHPEYDL